MCVTLGPADTLSYVLLGSAGGSNSSSSDTPSVYCITSLIFATPDIPQTCSYKRCRLPIFRYAVNIFFFPISFLHGLMLIRHLRCTFLVMSRAKLSLINIVSLPILLSTARCALKFKRASSNATWCHQSTASYFVVFGKEEAIRNQDLSGCGTGH